LVIIGQIEILYKQIYTTPYGEFREAKGMIDEMVMSSIDKALAKAKISEARSVAEGKAEGKAEVARTMLKEGISVDNVIRYTGLSLADIEKSTQTASSVFTGK
jgi:predicted transposase/invertase (TIGR01784 family)